MDMCQLSSTLTTVQPCRLLKFNRMQTAKSKSDSDKTMQPKGADASGKNSCSSTVAVYIQALPLTTHMDTKRVQG